MREPASFWRENKLDSPLYSTTCFSENVIVAETSYQNVRSFLFGLRSRLQRTSFKKSNDAYFTGEKNFTTLKLSRVSSFENTRQKKIEVI